jgi:hypothetical protein
VRLLGVGNTSYIRDLVGNGFVGDPANNNEYQLQFNTKGVKPIVSRFITPCVNAPRLNPNVLWSTETFAVTNRGTYAFDCAAALRSYIDNFTFDVSLSRQVKQGNPATWQYCLGTWGNANTTFNGDWEARLGKPGEAVVDWRVSGIGDSYIYQVDEANDSVAIINSGNGVIEGHFVGVGTPKGITISGPGSTGLSPVIYVANYAQGTVTGIPIGTIQPGNPICTAVQELRDDLSKRVFLQTGKNPNGVACEYFGLRVGAVVNQADNELQIFDPQSLQPINGNGVGNISQRFTVGENPVDVAFSPYLPLQGWIFAYVVNQGGPTNPDGSVSLWWNSTGLIGLFASASGSVPANLTDGIEAPGRPSSDPRALNAWICNTASDDVVKATITVVGSGLGSAISLDGTNRRVVGPNPMRMAWGGPSGAQVGFVALAGAGQVGAWELNGVIGPPVLFPLPGVSSMFSGWDQ